MVHTFQCLGVNIAVDVNSGAVHVLDELTYHLLEQVQPPMGEHCPAELCARLPQYDPAALEESWQELRGLAAEGLLFEEDDYIDREKAASMQQQALVKALAQYPEEVHQAARTYDPSRINRYLTGLAGDFHRFYNACRCMVDDPCLQAARLKLADTTRQVLANGLGLLGVSAPEKM